jgi:hypothetical protein
MQEFRNSEKGYLDMDSDGAIRELTAAEIEAIGGGVEVDPVEWPWGSTTTGPTFPTPPGR